MFSHNIFQENRYEKIIEGDKHPFRAKKSVFESKTENFQFFTIILIYVIYNSYVFVRFST